MEIVAAGVQVGRQRPDTKKLYGWGEITTEEVCNIGLEVEDDDEPPGHSSIVGWPTEEVELLPYQQELAKRARTLELEAAIAVR